MGGTPQFVFRNGQRLTLWMLYIINLLDRDLFALFGVHVIVSSAIRTYEEQKRIFLERYVTAGNIRGRRVYDTRVWNGVRYYRISSAGTVAVPGSSNHEIQGTKAAVDLRDTGGDAGITVRTSARGRWIRQNAHKYGLVASGDGFQEGWHFDILNIFRTPPTAPAGGSSSKGIQVKHYHVEDATCKASGRKLSPGNGIWLNKNRNAPVSQATNIAGGVGPYIITQHVYATGTPGDSILVALYWDNTKTSGAHSGHYIERMVFDEQGLIQRSVTSQRAVAKGFAVYGRLVAPETNKGPVNVTRFDTDAYLFI